MLIGPGRARRHLEILLLFYIGLDQQIAMQLNYLMDSMWVHLGKSDEWWVQSARLVSSFRWLAESEAHELGFVSLVASQPWSSMAVGPCWASPILMSY